MLCVIRFRIIVPAIANSHSILAAKKFFFSFYNYASTIFTKRSLLCKSFHPAMSVESGQYIFLAKRC